MPYEAIVRAKALFCLREICTLSKKKNVINVLILKNCVQKNENFNSQSRKNGQHPAFVH